MEPMGPISIFIRRRYMLLGSNPHSSPPARLGRGGAMAKLRQLRSRVGAPVKYYSLARRTGVGTFPPKSAAAKRPCSFRRYLLRVRQANIYNGGIKALNFLK